MIFIQGFKEKKYIYIFLNNLLYIKKNNNKLNLVKKLL